jgi:hypothetical protein
VIGSLSGLPPWLAQQRNEWRSHTVAVAFRRFGPVHLASIPFLLSEPFPLFALAVNSRQSLNVVYGVSLRRLELVLGGARSTGKEMTC